MGTLKTGDPFICGDYGGKIKSLMDDRGKPIKEAGPSTPVKVLGFSGLLIDFVREQHAPHTDARGPQFGD